MKKPAKVAAVQLAVKIGDSTANIERCERLALQAIHEGAKWIALPEFFTTGVCWNPRIVAAIQNMEGSAVQFMRQFSAKHQAVLGGSFLCRLPDGRVRNRYLCFAGGTLIGLHDKDLPTMWENYFYEGGEPDDSGILGVYEDTRIGAAVCWEFMRTMTARRLRNNVDVILGGSCWWSIPTNFPVFLQKLWEPENSHNALAAIQDTARLIGAPVIHAAHCGQIECAMPGLPIKYKGYLEGHAAIVDAEGRVLAHRPHEQGEGIVCAEILLQGRTTNESFPNRFWLRGRGFLPTFAWYHQRWLGRRWYKRHVYSPISATR